jgi:carbon-monoxide dehydrogenase medium subunit
MDLPPVLIALGATVTTAGRAGGRALALEELFTGYYETVLARDELIAEVQVPAQGHAAYLKVTTGSADDWPALGVAVALDAEGQTVKSARVVVSAATVKAMRLPAVEGVLAGAKVDDKVLARAGDATADVDVIADVRGSAPYKRELLRVYVGRAVRAALQAGGGH